MKRFYKVVSTTTGLKGVEILLDGKSVKTPYKNVLYAPTQNLADLVMQEWAAQEEHIVPDDMPLTQFLSTKIDRVSAERTEMTAAILKYLNTDLLCYHTDDPPDLGQKQRALWGPWLDWFEGIFGTRLETTTGLTALTQPQSAHEMVQAYVAGLDDNHFTILQLLVPLSGSLVLALAFVDGAVTAEQIFEAVHVEEDFKAKIYNEEKYGPDPLQEKKDRAMRVDLAAAQVFLNSLE